MAGRVASFYIADCVLSMFLRQTLSAYAASRNISRDISAEEIPRDAIIISRRVFARTNWCSLFWGRYAGPRYIPGSGKKCTNLRP